MSDLKVWNGTAWVRPRFWDGSTWREYQPPVYNVPTRNDFTAGPEGWESAAGPASWAARDGGVIYRRVNAQPWVHGPDPGWYGKLPDQNRPVGFRCSYALTVHSGTSAKLTYTFGSFGLGGHEEGFETPAVSRAYSEYQTAAFTTLGEAPGWGGGLDLFIGVESDNYIMDTIDMTLEVAWVQLVYADGSPVYTLGFPGWQPFVFDGIAWK